MGDAAAPPRLFRSVTLDRSQFSDEERIKEEARKCRDMWGAHILVLQEMLFHALQAGGGPRRGVPLAECLPEGEPSGEVIRAAAQLAWISCYRHLVGAVESLAVAARFDLPESCPSLSYLCRSVGAPLSSRLNT
jgi:hypothetical protein